MEKFNQPINIIGMLFALSIAFWGSSLVKYVQNEVPRFQGYWIDSGVVKELEKNKKLGTKSIKKLKDILKEKEIFPTRDKFEKSIAKNGWDKEDDKKVIQEKVVPALVWKRPGAKDFTETFDVLVSAFMILAGLAFLADIACIMWWYARYIYIINPAPTLPTHFLDFGICAAFNLAANAWTDPPVFLSATVAGAGLLFGRFRLLHGSYEASGTDRYILSSAARWMGHAAVLSLLGLFAAAAVVLFYQERIGQEWYKDLFHPVLVVGLSAIGIWLTFEYADKIRASAEMHENRQRHFVPMELHWPKPLKDDAKSRKQLTQAARKGLDRFRNLFSIDGVEHDRLISRVHAEADLRVQSYILAVPSWTAPEKNGNEADVGKKNTETAASHGDVKDGEVERKAFIVGLAHWLDDLVDGREELSVYDKVEDWVKSVKTFDEDENRRVFESVYRDSVENHADPNFYERLVKEIDKSAGIDANRTYLYFGFNRVALGSALFSPRLQYEKRRKLLESHGGMLERMVKAKGDEAKSEWIKKVNDLLVRLQERDNVLGHNLLGLTTKTAQEMGMASEGQPVYFSLSLLYSLLYAPMLYFHDIVEEVKVGEMAALETFNVNYEAIIPWIEEINELINCNSAPTDKRLMSRRLQVAMTFRCFKAHLPQVERDELEGIYDPERRNE